MSHHAKTPSAGSTSGQGASLGSFVRGAFAIRGASGGADGSGARSIGTAPAKLIVVLCLSVVAVLAALVSPALAAQSHPYTGASLGPDGVGGTGSFERVQGIAVDPANGDTYVYDGGAGKVYKFNASGVPVNFSATASNAITGVGGGPGGAEYEIALAPVGSPGGTAGDIYVANNGSAIHVYSAAGAELGELDQGGETCGVATDTSGNLYAGIYSNTINKFTPSANPPSGPPTATGTAAIGLCNVAADGLGNVYAANYSGGGLYKLEGIADTSPTLIDSGASTMAIAPGSNDLYADRGNEVFQYDSAGTPIGSFGNGELSESHGVAVNSGASKIYVGTSTKVKVFGPSTTVPDAITEAADAVTKTTAVLHGTVGAAGGPDATCVFQYVTESAFFEHGFEGASEKPCNPAGPFSGSGTTAVSATATGLSAETNYRVRLLATSSDGSNSGQALSFSTPGAVNVLTEPATGVTASSATLHGTINPEGTELEECAFEYRLGSGVFKNVPCAESPGAIGSGNTPVPVHLDLTGLSGGAGYEFRLVGKSQFGTSKGAVEEFKTPGPSVIAESFDNVTETAATLHATINPNDAETSYVFEYITTDEFEQSGYASATSVPAGGENIGAGTGAVEVSAEVVGLVPQAGYHFRVVASSSDGTTVGPDSRFTTQPTAPVFGACPNDVFRAGPGAALPDCRAYEQATPVDKDGGSAGGFSGNIQAAADGSAMSFYSQAGFPGGVGSQDFGSFVASRGDGSWKTAGSLPLQELGERAGVLGLAGNDEYALTQAYSNVDVTLAYRDLRTGETNVLVDSRPSCKREQCFAFAGASADGSRVFFESFLPVTEAPKGFGLEDERINLYMWEATTDEVTLVGVDEAGEPMAEGSIGGPYIWRGFGATTARGGAFERYYVGAIHAISEDGSQAVFTEAGTGQLFLRTGLGGSHPTTVHVSAPADGVESAARPAAFLEATPDGRFVFFKSTQRLTADAGNGEESNSSNLYRYEVATGELIDLTPEIEGSAEEATGPEVEGLLGASADGKVAYFAAKGVFAPGAVLGQENLYRVEADPTPQFTFVTGLNYANESENDSNNWSPVENSGASYSLKSARVSADGQVIVFSSRESLAGYDNTSANRQCANRLCAEFYRWSTATEQVQCLSCNPTGMRPLGQASVGPVEFINAALFPIFYPAPVLPRILSASGDRFFFQTPDPLVGRDTNSRSGCDFRNPPDGTCLDVYEWEAPGAGSCPAGKADGCLSLLSTGISEEASYLGDADRTGDNVFIFTSSQLVPSDRDSLYDIYDVSANGGLASQYEQPPARCTSGQACQGSGTQATQALSPGSASFQGPGNGKPKPKCGKKAKKCKKKPAHRRHKHGAKQKKRQGARAAAEKTKDLGGAK